VSPPAIVSELADRWSLRVGAPFEGSTVSWTAPAELPDGTEAVLKVNAPDFESDHEGDALAWWAGHGAVRLLAQAPEHRALLIERCRPATQLWSVSDDDEATRLAAGVLRQLWRPAVEGLPFRSLADDAELWSRHVQLPPMWRSLASSQPEQVVCHQDLHGGNVLADRERGWLAIDPKPVLGERAFDVASLLRDRRPALLAAPHPERVVRRRLAILADELDIDPDRARGWAIVHALAWRHPRIAELMVQA
jgi:streptomycin 6-kinase